MQEMGAEVSIYAPDIIKVKSGKLIKPVDTTTLPYPAIRTDLQAPMMSVLASAEGTSIITETIYEKSLHASRANSDAWALIFRLPAALR